MVRNDFYDVAVVGGGAAGVASAAAAVDAGANRVALIESSSRLGGAVSAAMHRCLCGLYSREPGDPLDTLNSGGQREIVANMVRHDPAGVVARQMGKTWVLEFTPAAWRASLDQVCSRGSIDRLMNCRVIGLHRNETRIEALQMQGIVPQSLQVGAVIDCTGAGALIQLAGSDVSLPADETGRRMLGGFSICLAGLKGNPQTLRLQIPYALTQAVASGHLPREARFTLFQPGPGDGQGVCKLAVNPQSSGDEVRALAERVMQHLRHEIPEFSEAQIQETSPSVVARDGLRLHGSVILTEEDVLSARKYGQTAVHAWWPIERWDQNDGPTYAYPPAGDHYDIPNGALQSASVKNLFAAGICVSATAGAAASLRASGICLATGDAAGRLAAGVL